VKTIPAALQAHYNSGATAMASAILIQRADGQVFGFTSADVPLLLNLTAWDALPWVLTGLAAFVFDSAQGLAVSILATTAGFEVDNAEMTTLDDGSLFDRDELLAGIWRNARWRIFRYRTDVAATIANDVETLQVGTLGEATLNLSTITIELRGLTQDLQQPIGIVSTRSCRARFGSQGLGRCNKDPAPFTATHTVTTATSKQIFTASSATQAADYYGYGIVAWLTGGNAGLSSKVREFAAGVFTLQQPMVFAVQVGDTFTAVAGCRGRRDQDCFTKFANVINFQGEPDRPTTDDLTSTP
jgi:uncharacterized phage protein (TIGR02218 family)